MDIFTQLCLDPVMARAIVAAVAEDRSPSQYLLTRTLEVLPPDVVRGEWDELDRPGPDGAPWDGPSTHRDRSAWVAQALWDRIPAYEWQMAVEAAYRRMRGHDMAERLWAWGARFAEMLSADGLVIRAEHLSGGVRLHSHGTVVLWAIIGSDGRLLMGGEGVSSCEMPAVTLWDWVGRGSLALPGEGRLRDGLLALRPRLADFSQCREARFILVRILRTALATALRDEASREPVIRLTWETLCEEDGVETARAVVYGRAEFADGAEAWDGPLASVEATADPVMTHITLQLQLLGRLWVHHYVDVAQMVGDLPRVQRLIGVWSRGLTARDVFEHVATQEAGR